jgi:CheY-like chemotaxis protein
VVHGIVSEHRGCITVDSTPGRGTTFNVYLPTSRAAVAAPPALAAAAVTGPAASDSASNPAPHVLLVDDDAVMLLTAQALLQRSGYRVSTARGGREALAVLQRAPSHFDAVVTDYNMPECSGFELARAAAALRPSLPVLIYSGYIDTSLRDEAERLGVRALVNKENIVEDLAAAVRLSLV